MLLKIILAWIIKIVTGSIAALVFPILINGKPDNNPIEKVLLMLHLAGAMVFLPAMVTVIVLHNMNKFNPVRNSINKIVRGYLVTFFITLGAGNILIMLFFKANERAFSVLNFSVVILSFGIGALLAWRLMIYRMHKFAPKGEFEHDPNIIDDL